MNKSFLHVNHLTEVGEIKPTYVAIGSFDGVHLGHQAVLTNMVESARAEQKRTAVLTFFPHPKRVIQQVTDPYYLSPLADRVGWLSACGVDLVITHPFDETVRQTRAADFVAQLQGHLGMTQLWGGDFALGYKREGDIPFLRRLGAEKGFSVEQAQMMVEVEGELVSSSRIRRHLRAGEVEAARACLSRPYRLHGEVVQGDQRGRTIGFPTANLDFWTEQLLPANGVYATIAWVGDTPYQAATNVGVRPTVAGSRLTVEAHLLDFEAELYGQTITLDFHGRVRPEKKFAGLDELKAQIKTDVAQIRAQLDSPTHNPLISNL